MESEFNFSDLIDNCGGTDGKLMICFQNADKLTFSIVGFDLLVWVTGCEEEKKHILNIVEEIDGCRSIAMKKAGQVREGLITELVFKGMTNATPRKESPEGKFNGNADVQEAEPLDLKLDLSGVIH